MTGDERRCYETFLRIRRFMSDNAADFPPATVGAVQAAAINAVIERVEKLMGDQAASSDEARQLFVGKDTARENLRRALLEISRTARSMAYQFDGIDDKFRMPRNRNDQELLAAGLAFHQNSLESDADFQTYGLDKNFRSNLQTDITAFANSLNPTGTAIDEQVAATAEIGAEIRRGMIARRILEGIVKNKFRQNVGKSAAWLSASHIERARPPAVPPIDK